MSTKNTNTNTKTKTAAEIVATLKRGEVTHAEITVQTETVARWSNYIGGRDVETVHTFKPGEVVRLGSWRPEGMHATTDDGFEMFVFWRFLEQMTAENTNTGAAVVASEKITEAIERFAKYREAAYKAREASREASRNHAQLWNDDDRDGNKARYNTSMQAAEAAEAAALACTFCRETVREMLAAEAVKAYADTIGEFVGKSAGPKTCEKVYKEIANRLEGLGFRGVRVWFGSPIYGGEFSRVEVSAEGLNGSENITLYGKYGENGDGNKLTDASNHFNGRELCGHEFPTDERTPEQFAADFIAAENALEALRKECEAKRDEIAKRVCFGSARPRSWHIANDSREA